MLAFSCVVPLIPLSRLLVNIPTAVLISNVSGSNMFALLDCFQLVTMVQFTSAIVSVVSTVKTPLCPLPTAQRTVQAVSNRMVRRLRNFSSTAPSR